MSLEDSPGAPEVLNGDPSVRANNIELRIAFSNLRPAATKWKKIGLELSCPPEELELIERKPRNKDDTDFLYDVLYYRLNKIEPTHLTWELICHALNSDSVGEGKLGLSIAKNHCPNFRPSKKRTVLSRTASLIYSELRLV